MMVLREYEDFYNTHRPHWALKQAAPLRPLPDGVTDLDQFRVQRRDRVGGVIHEYRLGAKFSAPTGLSVAPECKPRGSHRGQGGQGALPLLILLSRMVCPFGLWLGGRRKRESGVSPGLPRSGMWERLPSSTTGPAGLGSGGQSVAPVSGAAPVSPKSCLRPCAGLACGDPWPLGRGQDRLVRAPCLLASSGRG